MAPDGQEPAAGCCREAVAALLKSPQVEVRWRAVFALNQMAEEISPEHVPAIAELLGDEDASVRERAGDALARMGGAGAEALVKKVEDAGPDVEQEAALAALALVGQPGVRPAASRLDHGSAGVRRRAAATLQQLAAWAKEHAKDLARLLGDREEDVRLAAVQALVALGGDGAGALASAVASPKDVVKLHALQGLGLLGPAAGPHAVAVARLMDYPHEKVSAAANSTIEGLGAPGAAALCAHLRSDQADARANAVQALSKLADAGVDMLPFADALVAGLADPDGALRARAATALGRAGPLAAPLAAEPLAALLGDGAALAQGRGEEALSKMGVGGVAVLLGPLGLAHELPAVRAAALRCLRQTSLEVLEQVGLEEIVRAVGLHLADGDGQVRLASVQALGALPPPVAAASLAGLACCAADGSDPVRAAALLVLGALGPEHEGGEVVLAELARRMGDDAAEVRAAAAKAMGCFGEAAEKHVRLLVRVLKEDSFPPARASAAEALGLVGPAAGGFMQALVKALSDPERDVRRSTVDACGRLSVTTPQSSVQAAPGLAKVVLSPGEDGQLRAAAMAALRSMGKAGCACLMSSLSDVNPQVQLQAIDAFEQLDAEERQPHVQALGRLLQDEHPGTRARAAAAAGRLGQAGLHLAAALAQRLQDGDPGVREAVALALHGLGHEAVSKHAQHIARNLPNPHSGVRAAAARALGAAGAAGRAHAPTICQMLLDEEQAVRQSAWRALAELGEHAAHVVPSLAALLDGTHEDETTAVAVVVAQQGGEGVEAVCRYLEDARPAMRAACCAALGAVGGAGAPAAVRVAQLLEDIDPGVRATAREALLRMGAEADRPRLGELWSTVATPTGGLGTSLERALEKQISELRDQLTTEKDGSMDVDTPPTNDKEKNRYKSELAVAESMLKALPEDADTEFAQQQRLHLERHRDACKVKLREAQPFEWRAHDAVNQKKQLLEKKQRMEKAVEQAKAAVVKAQAAVDHAEEELQDVLEQPVAKEAEVQRFLGSLPTAPAERKLESHIESVGISVQGLGDLIKARGLDAGAADNLAVSLKLVMDQLRAAEVDLAGRHDIVDDKWMPYLSQGGRGQRIVTQEVKPEPEVPRDEDVEGHVWIRLGDYSLYVHQRGAHGGRGWGPPLRTHIGIHGCQCRPTLANTRQHVRRANVGKGAAALAGALPRAGAGLRQGAVAAVGRLGAAGAAEAPAVAARLVDPLRSVRAAAARALVQMGAPAAPVLAEALGSANAHVRRCAAEGLGCLGPAASGAAERLAAQVTDEDPVVQEVAILASGRVGEAATSALARQLGAADQRLQRRSAEALGRLGALASAQAPALAARLDPLLEDASPAVREACVWALGRVGPAGPQALADLLGVAHHGSTKKSVCGCLGRLGGAAARHSVAVAAELGGEDRAVAASAADALVRFGKEGAAALAGRLDDADPVVREIAAEAMGRTLQPMEAEHAQQLAARLSDSEILVRRAAATSLGRVPAEVGRPVAADLAALLGDEDAWVRARAAESLGRLGQAAEAHAPQLAALLEGREGWGEGQYAPRASSQAWGWQFAAEALRRCGRAEPGHAALLAAHLADPDAPVRVAAAAALGKLGCTAAAAQLQDLAGLLQDPDERVRRATSQALGEAGGGSAPAAAALASTLAEDACAVVRAAAATALGAFGESAAEHADAVAKALEDPDGAVRQAAAAALPLLGAEGLAKSPLLAQLLGDERASVREAAYAELVRCGAAGGAVTLAGVARDSSRPVAVRRVAAQGLAELGAAAAEQADALAGLLLVPDSALRESAVRGLAKMGPRGVTELERLLQHSSEQGRCAACQVLGSMGPAAGASAGALALRLDDHSPLVRRTAATALGRLGDAAAPQLPRLAALLEAHDALLFKSVLDVLGGLGRHAGKHAKAVAFRLDAAGDEVRQSAAHALGTLGEAAAGHAPDLARALLDREPMVRANSAWALGRCGEAGAAYVDRLAALLGDGDCRVRARACESLGRLLAGAGEGERREGAARLAGGLEDEDLAVRCAAAEAICRMGVDSMAPYAVGLVRVVENSSVGYDVTAVDARLAELLARELGVAFPHPLAFLPKAFAGDDLFPLAAEAEVPGKLGCVLSVLHAARWAPLLSSGDSWWTTRARPLQEAYIKGAKERASPAYLKQVDRVLEDFERSEKTGTPQPLTDAIEASLARSFGP
ncbi:unnamed protein product [Prorocentrum cordatum]|uniref:Uncharacterized protein n=1 Tax=Prorocentrum cordatum TaxID=2364126 RepID=A0ABN9TAB0_9DINO|nr:unnamed protein product [Polarella glacialis]